MAFKKILQKLANGEKVDLENTYVGFTTLVRTLKADEEIRDDDLVRLGSTFDGDEVETITYSECKRRGIKLNLLYRE